VATTVLVAQLSDPHIVPRGRLAYGTVDSAAGLRAAVAHVEGLRPRPNLVIVTGDLVDAGSPEEYDHLAELLDPLTVPVALLPGNHDDRSALRAAFPEQFAGCGPLLSRPMQVGALRILLLDTHLPGEPGGEVGHEQLLWLDHELAAAPDTVTIVALHHPPFITGLAMMDTMRLRDMDALAAVIARHRQVERVVAGHLHRPITTRFAGTVAMTAPSTSHQLVLALDPDAEVGYNREPGAILLHRWHPQHGLTSHVSLVGAFGPDISFD